MCGFFCSYDGAEFFPGSTSVYFQSFSGSLKKFTAVKRENSVHKNGMDSGCFCMRIFECCIVFELIRMEQNHVGRISGLQNPAVRKIANLCRERCHFSDSFSDALFFRDHAVKPWKAAEPARVADSQRIIFRTSRFITAAADVWLCKDQLQIFLR